MKSSLREGLTRSEAIPDLIASSGACESVTMSNQSVAESTKPWGGILAARSIAVRFQGLLALSDISLEIREGEVLGLIGPNGAGKTTLVNCLTGFQRPTTGDVVLNGASCGHLSADEFRKAGVARTFQAGRLFADLTVLENVEVAAVALGATRRAAVAEARAVLTWLGLAERERDLARVLPYTDQRRLGLARTIVRQPRFLLLDEPAAGMSETECEELIALIAEIPKRFACGVLLIEHNMHVVMSISSRVHVLDGGRTIAEETPGEIRRNQAVIDAYLGAEA